MSIGQIKIVKIFLNFLKSKQMGEQFTKVALANIGRHRSMMLFIEVSLHTNGNLIPFSGNSECEDIGGGKVEKPLEKPSKVSPQSKKGSFLQKMLKTYYEWLDYWKQRLNKEDDLCFVQIKYFRKMSQHLSPSNRQKLLQLLWLKVPDILIFLTGLIFYFVRHNYINYNNIAFPRRWSWWNLRRASQTNSEAILPGT